MVVTPGRAKLRLWWSHQRQTYRGYGDHTRERLREAVVVTPGIVRLRLWWSHQGYIICPGKKKNKQKRAQVKLSSYE